MINRVVLVGRLTKDVEVRKTQSGISMARFTVACDRRFSKAQDQGGNQQSADFISCVAWRQNADFLGNYAKKGAMVGVEGRIQTNSYERDGQRVYVTDVQCDSVQLLESRAQSQARATAPGYQDSYQSSYSQPAYQQSGYSQPYGGQQAGYQGSYQDSYQSSNSSFGSDDGFGNGQGLDISSDDLPF